MSATTKKKHVTKEVLEEYPLPGGERQVVKVIGTKGNNLHEVETAGGERFLASMPCKFRKHVWIKRGDFLLVEPIKEGAKVKAEISHILFKDQMNYIHEQGLWPGAFAEVKPKARSDGISKDLLPPSDSESDDDELGDLCINMNRAVLVEESDDSSDEDCSEDEEEEVEGEEICDNDKENCDSCSAEDSVSNGCEASENLVDSSKIDSIQHITSNDT